MYLGFEPFESQSGNQFISLSLEKSQCQRQFVYDNELISLRGETVHFERVGSVQVHRAEKLKWTQGNTFESYILLLLLLVLHIRAITDMVFDELLVDIRWVFFTTTKDKKTQKNHKHYFDELFFKFHMQNHGRKFMTEASKRFTGVTWESRQNYRRDIVFLFYLQTRVFFVVFALNMFLLEVFVNNEDPADVTEVDIYYCRIFTTCLLSFTSLSYLHLSLHFLLSISLLLIPSLVTLPLTQDPAMLH